MAEPISLADAKANLRLESADTAEDGLIARLIAQARGMVEDDTNLVIVPRRVTLTFERFSNPLLLREAWPVTASPGLTVTYVDTAGAAATVSNARLFSAKWPAQITPAINASFPLAYRQPEAVTIGINCGYADGAVPPALIGAMHLLINHWYANREAAVVGTINSELALGYQNMIADHILHIIK